jgi:hypothetical protein
MTFAMMILIYTDQQKRFSNVDSEKPKEAAHEHLNINGDMLKIIQEIFQLPLTFQHQHHRCLSMGPIIRELSPVQALVSYFPKIHFNPL